MELPMSGTKVTKHSNHKVIANTQVINRTKIIIFGHGKRTKNGSTIDLGSYPGIAIIFYIHERELFGFWPGMWNAVGTPFLEPLYTQDTGSISDYELSAAQGDKFQQNPGGFPGQQILGPETKDLRATVLKKDFDIISIRDKWMTASPITLSTIIQSAYFTGYREFHLFHCRANADGTGKFWNPMVKRDATGETGTNYTIQG
jgi:hypothetical protein